MNTVLSNLRIFIFIFSQDLKEVAHHRKKLQGRKLDYDCKKRQGVTDKELKQAEDKFAESLHLAQMGN